MWQSKQCGIEPLISPVRARGEPARVHEHWERRPVGEIMPEEVVEKQIVSRLLGAVVVASIDHGADGRRLLLVLIIHHRHFPKTRMRVLGAGTDLAFLSRLVIQRVWPDGRIVLG